MYARPENRWSTEKTAGIIVSILANLVIFVSFIWFTNIGHAIAESGASLAVFAFGEDGADAQETAAEPPPPPPPQQVEQRPDGAEKPNEIALLTSDERVSEEQEPETGNEVTPVERTEQPARQPEPREPARETRRQERAQTDSARQQQAPAGSQSDVRQASSAQASAGGGGDGDAYGAAVYAHLMRYRRSNTVGPGAVTIGFTVLADGGVQGIDIVRSSGSGRFDREATQMVRRAAPFPRPPGGCSRAFRFGIKGR